MTHTRPFILRVASCATLVLAGALVIAGCDDEKPKKMPSSETPDDKDASVGNTKDGGKKPPPPPPPSDSGWDTGIVDSSAAPQPEDAQLPNDQLDAGPPPEGWTCPESFWADAVCDCGCGQYDSWDCARATCKDKGCVDDTCDACFTTDYAWKACTADPDPSSWSCSAGSLNDALCDCGCDYPDPACHGRGCTEPGCWRSYCDLRHNQQAGDTTNAPPPAWKCAKDLFGSGGVCDCGCGARDPDCPFGNDDCDQALCGATGCGACHDKAGRPVVCTTAYSLGQWTCDARHYGSGDGCDCGCGIDDPDCQANGCSDYGCRASACARCTNQGFPNDDVGGCPPLAPAPQWACDPHHYGTNDGCDCGCGIHDPDCGPAADGCETPGCTDDGKCSYCHDGPGETPDDYVPCNGWTCGSTSDDRWAKPECDCGCGALDFYCRIAGRADCKASGCTTPVCELCNGPGGRGACGGERWSGVGGCDVTTYRDGVCDCGCGAIDVDCDPGKGCSGSACPAGGCDACYSVSGQLVACNAWSCPAEAYADGQTCDCGCGAQDPDCSNLGCFELGCNDAACDACHDPFGRVTPECP